MENSAQSILNNPTPATNEHAGREGSEFKKNFRIIAVVVSVAIVLVVGFLTALALSLLVKQPDDGSLKVGDTTITKATIDQYASGMKEFSDSHPEQNFGNDDFNQMARDDLIMNAALKQHAKACNASVSDKDVLTQAGYGNEPVESIDFLLGNKGDFRRIRNENEAYQSKMEQCIIAHKEIFSVRVFFNSPYFTSLPNQSAQGAFDAAKKRLEDEFLPLFKKKLSKEDIAAKADINYLDDIANEDEEYRIFSTTPAVTTSLEKYTSGFYNDLDVDYVANPGKLYTMESTANELNKVGDYIGVRATKISAFVIARLESKSPGAYKSWDDFLAKVKKDNGIETESSASKAVRAVGSAISDVFGALGDILPKTENVSAAASCHLAHFHYYAKDTATQANLGLIQFLCKL